MKNVLVKATKGVDNPADLGTKALSRDKIKKYLKALGYRGDFLDEEEQQVRKAATGIKSISVSMIAKIVAIVVSEGISVEETKVEAEEKSHEISASGNFGCCLLVLICIGLCCVFTMFVSAAVWDQAFGFGKEKEGRKGLKKLEKEKRREKMMSEEEKRTEEEQPEEVEEILQLTRDIAPPSEPAPTESGQGTTETRAGELRSFMLDAKAGRIAPLAKEAEKEAEKENPTVPLEASDVGKSKGGGVEEEDEESPEESSDTSVEEAEKENPTSPVPQTSSTNLAQVAAPEVSPEERKERLCRELDEGFRRKMQDLTNTVERGLACSATRTVVALFHGSVSALHTPSDTAAEDVKEFRTLGEINRGTLTTLEKTKRRSEPFRLLLKAKESHLIAQKAQLDQELSKKINWIQSKLRAEQAEDGAIERRTSTRQLKITWWKE